MESTSFRHEYHGHAIASVWFLNLCIEQIWLLSLNKKTKLNFRKPTCSFNGKELKFTVNR